MKKALITGITGQDGSYLAEFLLAKGYEVHGIVRRTSMSTYARLEHLISQNIEGNLKLHYGDLCDAGNLTNLLYDIRPDEIYNLGAQSHVRISFDIPENTGEVTGISTTRLLEAMRKSCPKARFYQASSSEMFGATPPPQSEKTLFHPRSPYAVAKVYSYWMTVNYRESYDLFACNGILFNHESPRRGLPFVTRKITSMLAKLLLGKIKSIPMGNLNAKRDWGFAPDFVEAMYLMLQQDKPQDYVVGTGAAYSVRDFIETAFTYAGIDIEWRGQDTEEVGLVKSLSSEIEALGTIKTGDTVITIDPYYFRPAEVDYLLADPSKAMKELNWEPKVSCDQLVKIMVDSDLKEVGLSCPGDGLNFLEENYAHWLTKA